MVEVLHLAETDRVAEIHFKSSTCIYMYKFEDEFCKLFKMGLKLTPLLIPILMKT